MALLGALAGQDFPSDLVEVIVVDDGSLSPVVVRRDDLRVRVVRLEGVGPAAARNAGVAVASGDVIAMTDDDCVPRPDWLRQLVAVWMTCPEALVGGATISAVGAGVFARASQLLLQYQVARMGGGNEFFSGMNLACARSRFLELGGFEELFVLGAEDRDLCDRWKASGGLVAAPEAVVEVRQALSLTGFLEGQFREGRGARWLRMWRFRRGETKFRLEAGGFYAGLVTWPFLVEPWYRAPITCVLFLAAMVCRAGGYLFEANVRWMTDAVLLPFRRGIMRRNLVLLHDTLAATSLADKYWMIGGLLIGVVREGDVLGHDTRDSDFGVYRADVENLFEAAPALERAGFEPMHRYLNNDGEIVQLSWQKDGARFDFNVHDGMPEFCGYTCFGSGIQMRGQLRAYELGPVEFLGRTWQKPADHDWYLTSIYGDWLTPDPSYDYRTDDRSYVETVPWLRGRESLFPVTPKPYVYLCTDHSWLTGVISARVAPVIERWLPAGWSANAVTWLGSALVWGLLAGTLLSSPERRVELAPLWIGLLSSYSILDHVDGCRARRLGTSCARGEFLDHGLDAWNGSLAVLALSMVGGAAIGAWETACALLFIGVATAAVWLEQKRRGEFVLAAVGPVEGVLAAGLYLGLWRWPAAAALLRAEAVNGMTWGGLALVAGAGGSLVPVLMAARRTHGILLPLVLLAGAGAAVLVAGLFGTSWLAVQMGLALLSGEYSLRVIRSHLKGTRLPWPDLVGPLLFVLAAFMPATAVIGLLWLVCRTVVTWRGAQRVLAVPSPECLLPTDCR